MRARNASGVRLERSEDELRAEGAAAATRPAHARKGAANTTQPGTKRLIRLPLPARNGYPAPSVKSFSALVHSAKKQQHPALSRSGISVAISVRRAAVFLFVARPDQITAGSRGRVKERFADSPPRTLPHPALGPRPPPEAPQKGLNFKFMPARTRLSVKETGIVVAVVQTVAGQVNEPFCRST